MGSHSGKEVCKKHKASHITNDKTLNTSTRKTQSAQNEMRLIRLLKATERTAATKDKLTSRRDFPVSQE